MEKKEVRMTILAATAKVIATYADKHELGVGEAVDKLIGVADARLKALSRYAKNKRADAAPPKTKTKTKKKAAAAKKPPAKKKAAAKSANGAAAAAAHA